MESDRVIQLQEAIAALRDAEERRSQVSGGEKRSLTTTVRQIGKTVNALQRSTLREYPATYVACRDLGHVWSTIERYVDGSVMVRTLKCGRCDMIRVEGVSKFGELLWRRYNRPDGYLVSSQGGAVKFTKDFWRGLEFMMAATGSGSGSQVAEPE